MQIIQKIRKSLHSHCKNLTISCNYVILNANRRRIDMIERKDYFENLKSFREKQIIKVVTGIRRCGKSTLFELYQQYLISEGVDERQIIYINFEDADKR